MSARPGTSASLLGLSGGIDSALTAAVAAAALGPDRVTGVLPAVALLRGDLARGRLALAANLGLGPVRRGLRSTTAHVLTRDRLLEPHVAGGVAGITDENLQARAPRHDADGDLERRSARLVLATSNKSELAVGY